jgi:hypothetical protein
MVARYCEACGQDSLPPGSSLRWIVIVDADASYRQPFPARRIVLRDRETLIGRRDRRRHVEPGIDLSVRPADHGVSARHALLRIDGSGLTVTDLGSMNGTRLDGEVLPVDEEVALAVGDCLHLGAWTTITVEAVGEKPAQLG